MLGEHRRTSATTLTTAALAGALALAIAGAPAKAQNEHEGEEKCYGIAKAGENDCANDAAGHSCAGLSPVAAHGRDSRYVPVGTCERIVGGHREPQSTCAGRRPRRTRSLTGPRPCILPLALRRTPPEQTE